MTLCQLIKAIDDFNGKFGIGGVGVNFDAPLLGFSGVSNATLITNTSVATQTICQVCLVMPPSWYTLGSV
jgi:hypothetical protein